MAYSLVIGDIVELRVLYAANSQRLLNVFHYGVTADGDAGMGETELDTVLTAMNSDAALWVQTWAVQGSNTCVVERLEAQKIYPIRRVYRSLVSGITGSVVGGQFPQNVQLSVTKVGDIANRHGTGQVRVPGIHGALVANGSITATGATWLTNLGVVTKTNLVAGGGDPLVMTPLIFNRGTPPASQPVTGYRVQTSSRVARRRTVRVGE